MAVLDMWGCSWDLGSGSSTVLFLSQIRHETSLFSSMLVNDVPLPVCSVYFGLVVKFVVDLTSNHVKNRCILHPKTTHSSS